MVARKSKYRDPVGNVHSKGIRASGRRNKKGGRVAATIILAAFALAAIYLSHNAALMATPPPAVTRISTSGVELPLYTDSQFVISNDQGAYTLMYDTAYRQAGWVAYRLTRQMVSQKGAQRSNRFIPDPVVVQKGWPTAEDDDYRQSGYDKGHLIPSADRDDDQIQNDATFYFSNISPQKPALNRRVWNRLETQVRKWAYQYDTVYIVTGGTFHYGMPTIGKNKVAVPPAYYKAVLANTSKGYIAIGFIIPNSDAVDPNYWNYSCTVDKVEQETGLDLFHKLPDSIETRIEGSYSKEDWVDKRVN